MKFPLAWTLTLWRSETSLKANEDKILGQRIHIYSVNSKNGTAGMARRPASPTAQVLQHGHHSHHELSVWQHHSDLFIHTGLGAWGLSTGPSVFQHQTNIAAAFDPKRINANALSHELQDGFTAPSATVFTWSSGSKQRDSLCFAVGEGVNHRALSSPSNHGRLSGDTSLCRVEARELHQCHSN